MFTDVSEKIRPYETLLKHYKFSMFNIALETPILKITVVAASNVIYFVLNSTNVKFLHSKTSKQFEEIKTVNFALCLLFTLLP
jgi:hypothetical protein